MSRRWATPATGSHQHRLLLAASNTGYYWQPATPATTRQPATPATTGSQQHRLLLAWTTPATSRSQQHGNRLGNTGDYWQQQHRLLLGSNTGDYSAASNTGDYSAPATPATSRRQHRQPLASNTGNHSQQTATVEPTPATARQPTTEPRSSTCNTGYQSATPATSRRQQHRRLRQPATGDYSAANTGYYSAASNTGNRSVASNTGYYSQPATPATTGSQQHRLLLGSQQHRRHSAASNTGYQSAQQHRRLLAASTGYQSAAEVSGGIRRRIPGIESRARVCRQRHRSLPSRRRGRLIHIRASKVGRTA